MIIEKADLYFKEGSSDKEYHARIEKNGDGFVVNFEYGRRGSTLTAGTKTQNLISLDEAKKIFTKLVKEKMAKGYSPGEAGTPYASTGKEATDTGIRPQLLNEIEEHVMTALIADNNFYAQEKHNGKRILLQKTEADVAGINKKGLVCGIPAAFSEAANGIDGTFVLDGEACGETYHAFDLLELNGEDMRRLPYATRLTNLAAILANVKKTILLVETAQTEKQKTLLVKKLREDNKEGVVFKMKAAPYTPGKPNSGGTQLKFKFEATLSAIVSRINDKRSVGLQLVDGKVRVDVGNVTIPPNQEIPKVGDVVEILYLYGHRGGSLVQPRCLGVRDDEDAENCRLGQVKYKPE